MSKKQIKPAPDSGQKIGYSRTVHALNWLNGHLLDLEFFSTKDKQILQRVKRDLK